MENKEKSEVKKIIDSMFDFLIAYSDDILIKTETEDERILITFITRALDERIRSNILRTIKQSLKLNYTNSLKVIETANMVSDIRMETTDDETKIVLIKNREI